jgi:hypothetical protein
LPARGGVWCHSEEEPSTTLTRCSGGTCSIFVFFACSTDTPTKRTPHPVQAPCLDGSLEHRAWPGPPPQAAFLWLEGPRGWAPRHVCLRSPREVVVRGSLPGGLPWPLGESLSHVSSGRQEGHPPPGGATAAYRGEVPPLQTGVGKWWGGGFKSMVFVLVLGGARSGEEKGREGGDGDGVEWARPSYGFLK